MSKLEREVTVQSGQGLHARPAALFVQLAGRFESTITVVKDDESVNGKSIMGILMLGAQHGTTLKLIVEGPDAEAAAEALAQFLATTDVK